MIATKNIDRDAITGAILYGGFWIVTKPLRVARTPVIIGLCGHMGVGKDAAAALLSMVGYRRVAFADQVRSEVAVAVAGGMIPRVAVGCMVPIARDIAAATFEEVYAKPTSERMRRILQWWGAEYRRAEDPDYWLKAAIGRIDGATVFSDVRFPNEVAAIRELGGVIWKIDRPVTLGGIPGHTSEAVIEDIIPDLAIDNTGALIDLAGKLRAALA